ncbi:MAG: hypothetical protein FWD57_17255, partial [Polyangiaceae bacterium]|nr:hypothetical protein [Polyangiaceae bacterium]
MFRTNASDAFWFAVSCGCSMACWDIILLIRATQSASLLVFAHAAITTATLTAAHVLLAGAIAAPLYAFAMGNQRIGSRIAGIARATAAHIKHQPPTNAVTTHASLFAAPFAIITYGCIALAIA